MQKILFVLFIGLLFFAFFTCETSSSNPEEAGKELAASYCGGCHEVPDPVVLDKTTWEKYVLPRMGHMLGVYTDEDPRSSLLGKGQEAQILEKANIYPVKSVIKAEDWNSIVQYYIDKAPAVLPDNVNRIGGISKSLELFNTRFPDYKMSPPSTTLVQFSKHSNQFFIGDANTKAFYQFDSALEIEKTARVNEGAVNLIEADDALYITVMGSFSPTDEPKGFMVRLPYDETKQPRVIINQLKRPVHSATADFDGDGLYDFVISEFGKWTGCLAWWRNNGDGTFTKLILKNQTGAIKTELRDFNGDGKMDILALFGQGREGIYLFTNNGNATFSEKQILEFSSSYGSSFFELYDFNGDGMEDIIYTAGDNADYPPLAKPYHGIRVFENKGDDNYELSFFYPLYGAYAAKTRDFDQDGDIDIAAISFFPDFQHQPEASFVYLENKGMLEFDVQTFPTVNSGRWIVMDVGDVDEDEDLDILLGALTFEVVPKMGFVEKWVEQGIPFVLLENNLK